MSPVGPRPFPPAVVVLTRAALAVAVLVGGVYLLGWELLTPVGGADAREAASSQPAPRERRLYGLVRMMAVSAVALAAFVLGSYLMIRAGRAVLSRPPPRSTTEYTDAWSRYRLTQEQIEAATRESHDEDKPSRGEPG
jgi:hypothetical protein